MPELRLAARVLFQDPERDIEYFGPGTFELSEDAAEDYRDQEPWEPVDAFSAEAFVSRYFEEVMVDLQSGRFDDKLLEIQTAERKVNREKLDHDEVIVAIQQRKRERHPRTGETRNFTEDLHHD